MLLEQPSFQTIFSSDFYNIEIDKENNLLLAEWLRGVPPAPSVRARKAKVDARARARKLRADGWSYNAIAAEDSLERIFRDAATVFAVGMCHQVLTAPNGIDGFALVQQEQPDLVILDVMMPDVDGYTVCQRIRKNEDTAGIPVLMLTALGVLDDKVKGFDVGAQTGDSTRGRHLEPRNLPHAIALGRGSGLPSRLAAPGRLV